MRFRISFVAFPQRKTFAHLMRYNRHEFIAFCGAESPLKSARSTLPTEQLFDAIRLVAHEQKGISLNSKDRVAR